MKAVVIEQNISNSMLDWSHGFTRKINRLYVPSIKAMVTLDGETFDQSPIIYVWHGEPAGDYITLAEVDVPDAVAGYIESWLFAKKMIVQSIQHILAERGPSASRTT